MFALFRYRATVHLGIHCTLCESVWVYLCPTRYDSASWWGQRSLINLAHHLLLEANDWRYKGVLYKQSCICRTQCSQNSSSIPAKSRLQQPSLGGVGICLYCILLLYYLYKSRREHVHSQNIMGEIMAYLECLQTGLLLLQGLLLLLLVHPAGWEGEGHPGVGQGRHRIGQSVGSADKNTDPHRSEISRPDQFNTVHNHKRSQYLAIYKSLANGCCCSIKCC